MCKLTFPASVCFWTHQTRAACAPIKQHLPQKQWNWTQTTKVIWFYVRQQLGVNVLLKPPSRLCCLRSTSGGNKSRKLDSDTHLPPRLSQTIVSHNAAAPRCMCAYGSNHASMTCRDCSPSYAPISPRHQTPWTSIAQPRHDIYSHWCVSAAPAGTATVSSAPWLRHMKGLLRCQALLCLRTAFYCEYFIPTWQKYGEVLMSGSRGGNHQGPA